MDYICPTWPFYDLGKGVKFEDGRFSTGDPDQISFIESNDKYKVFIWPVSLPAVKEEAHDKASERRVSAPQQDKRKATRPSKKVKERSVVKGRKPRGVLQELEDIVRKSGIGT